MCLGCLPQDVIGNPDPERIRNSYVERQKWACRTNTRRYARLSNGFGRKLENHETAVALSHFAYNFVRAHRTLRVGRNEGSDNERGETVTRRDWWLGVLAIVVVVLFHAVFPRYEWRTSSSHTDVSIRIDRWRGTTMLVTPLRAPIDRVEVDKALAAFVDASRRYVAAKTTAVMIDAAAQTYGRGGAQPFITAAEKSLIADEAEIVRDDAKATYDAMLADFTKQQKAGAIK